MLGRIRQSGLWRACAGPNLRSRRHNWGSSNYMVILPSTPQRRPAMAKVNATTDARILVGHRQIQEQAEGERSAPVGGCISLQSAALPPAVRQRAGKSWCGAGRRALATAVNLPAARRNSRQAAAIRRRRRNTGQGSVDRRNGRHRQRRHPLSDGGRRVIRSAACHCPCAARPACALPCRGPASGPRRDHGPSLPTREKAPKFPLSPAVRRTSAPWDR